MPTHSRHRDTQARPQACMLTTTANNKLNVCKNETRRTLPVTAEYSMLCSTKWLAWLVLPQLMTGSKPVSFLFRHTPKNCLHETLHTGETGTSMWIIWQEKLQTTGCLSLRFPLHVNGCQRPCAQCQL